MSNMHCRSTPEGRGRRPGFWWCVALLGSGVALSAFGSGVDPFFAPILKGAGRGFILVGALFGLLLAYTKGGFTLEPAQAIRTAGRRGRPRVWWCVALLAGGVALSVLGSRIGSRFAPILEEAGQGFILLGGLVAGWLASRAGGSTVEPAEQSSSANAAARHR